MTLVAVTGKKRHGKGTVAKVLVEHYGFVQHDFADALRACAAAIDPIVGAETNYTSYKTSLGDSWDTAAETRMIRYNEAIEEYGYELAKETFPEIVQFLQRLGTDAGRRIVGDDIWVQAWENNLPRRVNVVAADVRFVNEWDAFRARDLMQDVHLIKVVRPGYVHDVEQDKHPSEQGFAAEATHIITTTELDFLVEQVHNLMRVLQIPRITPTN